MRLDKILANSGFGSRKEVKSLIKSGAVLVSNEIVKDPGFLVDIDEEDLLVNGKRLQYKEFHYLMMNKPPGFISATWDRDSKTVIDLLDEPYNKFGLFPVGRLDKDTEGLLLLTNDGQLAHKLLSPKKQVPKTYYAEVSGKVVEHDIVTFQQGIPLESDFTTLPAELDILAAGDISKVLVTIYEGKFHQVKRMFEAVGKSVLFLKRISMGNLKLDDNIPLGEYKELTEKEMESLRQYLS
ncbi:MAG: rRNA pseudouridine synthase [Clostridiales bacterium]|nr:rRNA pseudouridine synthase [Clostridiales bacterium]